jgi:hypothetical protein
MRTKLAWFLIQVVPVVFTTVEMTTVPAQAITEEHFIRSSKVANAIFAESKEKSPETIDISFQTWISDEITDEWQISDTVILTTTHSSNDSEVEDNDPYETLTSDSIQPSLKSERFTSSNENSSRTQPAPLIDLATTEAEIANVAFTETEIPLTSIVPSELEQFTLKHWQSAQAEPSPESDILEDNPEPILEQEETSRSPRWQFTFTPYGFIPLTIDGSATVRDFTADVDLGLDDLLDPLNFAAAGRVEAWRGSLGFIFDGAYFSVGQEASRSRSIPNCLCDIFPSKIDTEVDVQYGQFDLGVGYRVAANAANAATEFELGSLVFDAIVGVRIYAIQQEIDISTNIGTDRNLEHSNTIVTPMASGRFRWNMSPTLAGWVRGDIAGFGIGGTLLAASVTGGVDWMFSGDTSLLLAYRISSLRYDTEVQGRDFELDLLLQGPYMGIVFRF